jgi:UDP-N-acetylmuramoyl-tripeptide--D-alanyl-D-alanine ligase
MKIDHLYKQIAGREIVTDTRKIVDNSVFFALKGANFNGNEFTEEALKKGAALAVIDENKHKTSGKTVLVKDVLKTLQQLARYHRQQLKIPIIALTGSNGKTTTKELIKAVLSQKFKVCATVGNYNNHIGVPLTLLSMTKDTDIGIVEMGANHPGEIAFLCQLAEPNFGYITNFGKAHLEGFGSLEGVVKAKSEIYEYLRKTKGYAFVNTDDAIQKKQTRGLRQFSYDADEIKFLNANPFVVVEFNKAIIKSNLIGSYNYKNIAAAIAFGDHFKIQVNNIKKAIEGYKPTNNRSQIIKKGQLKIILDAYNANPTSMQLALENFEQLSEKPKYLILGDMFELGTDSQKEHQSIVKTLEKMTLEKAFIIGDNFFKTKTHNKNIQKFKTFEEFKSDYKLSKKGILLVKASRGMALERILDF